MFYTNQEPLSFVYTGYELPEVRQPSEGRASSTLQKPTNAIYIKSLPYDLPNSEFLSLINQFGQVGNVFQKISDRGFAFVTYFDSRSAEQALKALNGSKVRGRTIDVTFSEKRTNAPGQDPYSTSPFVSISAADINQQQFLNANNLLSCVSQFGEVKRISTDFPNQIIIEFYDFRAAAAVSQYSGYLNVNGIICYCYIVLEIPTTASYVHLPVMQAPQYVHKPPSPLETRLPSPPMEVKQIPIVNNNTNMNSSLFIPEKSAPVSTTYDPLRARNNSPINYDISKNVSVVDEEKQKSLLDSLSRLQNLFAKSTQ